MTGRRRPPQVVLDAAAPVFLAVLGLVEVLFVGPEVGLLVSAVLGPLPLLVRRRWPVAAGLGSVVVVMSGGLLGADLNAVTVAIGVLLLACYGFSARCSLGRGLAATVGAVLVVMFGDLTAPAEAIGPDALFGGILAGSAFAAGRVVRSRSEALQAAARGAEALAQAAREAAVAGERARIARELHDLVAHSLAVMVVQAAAAEAVLGTDPDRARRALQDVQRTGREALGETRDLLDLLRDDSSEAPDDSVRPQPGLHDLASLADRFAGTDVDVEVDAAVSEVLPVGAEVSVYRVVQEAVTNVVKHSTAGRASVRVRAQDGEVVVEVDDAGPARAGSRLPGGHGLVGLGERVALYGGSLQAGPRDDGGFRVVARFPARVPA